MLRGLNRQAGATLLALLLGLGLGAWGMRLYFDRTLRQWDPEQRLVAQLDADLDLSEVQKERISIVLAEQKARMEARRMDWELDVRVLGREGEDAIARLLDAKQAARFSAQHERIHGSVERYLWASQGSSSVVPVAGP